MAEIHDSMTSTLRPLPELVSFLESLPEPHILCDRSYRILAANAAYRAKCARPEDLVGRTCYEVSHRYPVPCDRAGESCPLALSLQSGQRERVVHLHHTSSGERYEKIELSPVRDARGEIAYFIEKLEPLPVARGVAGGEGLIGRAATFRAMLELVARVAPSEATVLLQGESGTGKELVARAIHDASRRADRPFVAVDCSGLTETLFESELFGHEKGAFTGASQRARGKIELAHGGTLFLDEIGELPLDLQPKLLRVLDRREVQRIGESTVRKVDVRIVAATHRDLKTMVSSGSFREDLYFRLSVMSVELPPLRERGDDILVLAEKFIADTGRRLSGKHAPALGLAARQALLRHPWPGNVRELKNTIERATYLAKGPIEPADLLLGRPAGTRQAEPAAAPSQPAGDLGALIDLPFKEAKQSVLDDFETRYFTHLLEAHDGNLSRASAEAGITRYYLRELLKRLGLHRVKDDDA